MRFPILASAALALSSALCLAGPAAAQDQQLPAPVPAKTVPAETVGLDETGSGVPALWKVADEDTTIYLFGTVHSLPADVDWYRGELAAALDSSDELVTEIDMNPEAMAAMQQVIVSKALLQEGTLRGLMSEDQLAIYEGAMAKLGLSPDSFDSMEPWFAALMLSNSALSEAGFSPAAGAESVLEDISDGSKKRSALETVEFQMSIFDELPMDAQMRFLLEGAEEIDTLADELQKMVDEWAVGDAEGLAVLLNEAFEEDPVLAERLLYSRNADWAVWIDDRLDEPGKVFMAVGAGHLAGNNSVQELLAERGITALRVQ
ncbi:TraB/GumN family protein [Altererythrobacter sp. MTPC7]|uniref:TraB/GumN family protein n=1 Tax=Altererythrobacter sp. MTPC7 TaxID=3056567 RepID=UPI0036F3E2A2